MAKFLTSSKLNSAIEDIFENANSLIVLISPYIKLHDRYISVLKSKAKSPEIKIIVVFGKNEDNVSKSLKKEDLDFFVNLPNIEIRYEKRLHAKYYANEGAGLLTSMNLYSYSQDNNIEAGILTGTTILGGLTGDSVDLDAYNYFERVIEQSELIFRKEPRFESKLLNLSKKYIDSQITANNLDNFFKLDSRGIENVITQKPSVSSKSSSTIQTSNGYCIRSGKAIPFNPKMPLCDEAYVNWLKFKNEEYPEKYCHFSGEPSKGETSFSKPILRKNWQKARDLLKV
jgi:hypothetical protein